VDYLKKFLVEPGARVRLDDFDPGFKVRLDPKKEALPELEACVRQLQKLQYEMYAEHRHALLIVLQGLDASGKDGVIRHVITAFNPQGCRVTSFKQPTRVELDHDFLWRVHPHTPGRGDVVVFNRSHYEDVLVARVHRLVPKSVWSRRYDLINDFEETLHDENETTIVKLFLHISKEEQLLRFAKRLDDPERQWKISESDYDQRQHWDEYTSAYEDMLSKTSTGHAPWFVVPSDRKWFRNLAVAHILSETLQSLDIQLPACTVDLQQIRKRFHRELRSLVKEPRDLRD
jgi:PPK2 family polyphosphate:nucleotide phosphotransferase